MGRAKSNTKRRPKGKRGWRKIEIPELDNTNKNNKNKNNSMKKQFNFDAKTANDKDLFFFDNKPKQRKIKNIKQSSKDSLINLGIQFNDDGGLCKNIELQKKLVQK